MIGKTLPLRLEQILPTGDRDICVTSVRHIHGHPRWIRTVAGQSSDVTLELDSHADTCCVGMNALIIYDYDRPVTVYGYDKTLGAQTYRTVSAVVLYRDPTTGTRYFLVIHQAIEIPTMTHNLLCPMQCRVNGVTINECPKFLLDSPDRRSHAIIVTDPDDNSDLILPLFLKGVTSFLPVQKPSIRDWDYQLYARIDLTSETLDWNPASTRYQEQEEAMTDYRGQVTAREPASDDDALFVCSMTSTMLMPSIDLVSDDNFASALKSKVQQVSVGDSRPGNVTSKQGKHVDAQALVRRWGITPERAKRTVRVTTQRGVRHVLHPSLARRYPTNDRMLRYDRLPHKLFTDTMFAGTTSLRGNNCSQVFASQFG